MSAAAIIRRSVFAPKVLSLIAVKLSMCKLKTAYTIKEETIGQLVELHLLFPSIDYIDVRLPPSSFLGIIMKKETSGWND